MPAENSQSDTPPPLSGAREESSASLIEGMPRAYFLRHSSAEIRAHASVVANRGDGLVTVRSSPGPAQGEDGEWLCVVTDDRPGLLSLLSAAISAHSLDILSARVYCRTRRSRKDEAVDLFAVRRLKDGTGRALDHTDFQSIEETIAQLLRGEIDVASLEKRAAQTSRPTGAPPVDVYFDDSRNTDLMIVEAGDRPGLLLAISLTIFRERLTIVRSHVTTFATTARDEFELAELDGSRLSTSRRSGIAEKVRDALTQETVTRTPPPPALDRR